MSDATTSLLLPFAVCTLRLPAFPADGCLSPSCPGLGCTACTLPGRRCQPSAKRGSTEVGAGASPLPHGRQERGCRGHDSGPGLSAGGSVPWCALAPLLLALACACVPAPSLLH